MAAAREYRDPFVKDDRADGVRAMMSDGCQSDQLLMADILGRYQEVLVRGGESRADAFCRDHMLSPQTMRQMHQLQLKLADMVGKAGLVPGIDPKRAVQLKAQTIVQASELEHDSELVRAMVCCGLLPNSARVFDKGGKRKMMLKDGGRISAQSKSVLQLDRLVAGNGFVCFHELIKTSQLYASDLCYAGTMSVAIFSAKVEAYGEGLVCDGWMRLAISPAGADAIMAIRAAAKRVVDRHVCGVMMGTKSHEVDLEGVVNALRSVHGSATSRLGADRLRDDASSISSASTVSNMGPETRVLQYLPSREAFRRELDRGGFPGPAYGGGGGGGGGGRGGFGERGGGGYRDRDAARGGGFGGHRMGGGGEQERDWRAPASRGGGADYDGEVRRTTYDDRRGGGFGPAGSDRPRTPRRDMARDMAPLHDSLHDSRLDELKARSSAAPAGPPGARKYVPPSRRGGWDGGVGDR